MPATLIRNCFTNKGCRWIGGGWTLFILENLVLSDNRDMIIAAYDESSYHYLYNTFSSLACGSIAYGFIKHRKNGLLLGSPSNPKKLCGYIFQSVGFIGISQLFPKLQSPYVKVENTSVSPPTEVGPLVLRPPATKMRCPIDFKPVDVPHDGIYGLERITRHPALWSFGFLTLGQACTAVFLPEVIFFAYPIVFAGIGGWHQDVRYLRGSGGSLTEEKYRTTSNIPFLALLQGKQSWKTVLEELKWSNATVAMVLSSTVLMFRKM